MFDSNGKVEVLGQDKNDRYYRNCWGCRQSILLFSHYRARNERRRGDQGRVQVFILSKISGYRARGNGTWKSYAVHSKTKSKDKRT